MGYRGYHSGMKKAAFIHINRTGGTSIKTAMDIMPGHGVLEPAHETLDEMMNRLGPVFYERMAFSVIRNPWDRLVSQYWHRWNINYRSIRFRRISFEHFVRACYVDRAKPDYDVPRYFWPQSDWLRSRTGTAPVTIFRFEDGLKSVAVFLRQNGYPAVRLAHLNAARRIIKASLSPEMIDVLENHFKIDFARFGYDPDPSPFIHVVPIKTNDHAHLRNA